MSRFKTIFMTASTCISCFLVAKAYFALALLFVSLAHDPDWIGSQLAQGAAGAAILHAYKPRKINEMV